MPELKSFGSIATSLARNPLGIIALFIVLVYGFACLITGFATHLSLQERLPLVWFIVCFPVLVLAVFSWLVSCHSTKLFAPSDFQDDKTFVQLATAAGSLVAAKSKTESLSEGSVRSVIEMVQANAPSQLFQKPSWKRSILWVDDRPDNNIYERQAFEAFGISISLALSTREALQALRQHRFAVIISDMGRQEGPREGYVLLDQLRKDGNKTPLFFYAASNAPEHKRETLQHGGQGCTNSAEELYGYVMAALAQY